MPESISVRSFKPQDRSSLYIMIPLNKKALAKSVRRQISFIPLLSIVDRLAIHAKIARREKAARVAMSKLFKDGQLKVLRGPFKGLKYARGFAFGSVLIPKLLGTYEEELHEHVEALILRNPRTIIDVGAAEGFYAVGLAMRVPEAHVVAFEMNSGAQQACRDMAQFNGVDAQIEVRGACTRVAFDALVAEHPTGLILCDCEGFEVPLFRDAAKQLVGYDILVELHDMDVDGPTISEQFQAMFQDTHDIKIINTRHLRSVDHLKHLGVDERSLHVLLEEDRTYSIGWALITAR